MEQTWDSVDASAEAEGSALDFFDKLMSDDGPGQEVRAWSKKVKEKPTKEQRELLNLLHPLGKGHPLGHALTMKQAAERLGISKPTAKRRLASLYDTCPGLWAELKRWPSPKQMELVFLLSAHYKSHTLEEAAKILGVSLQDVYWRAERIHKEFPYIKLQYEAPSFVEAPAPDVRHGVRDAIDVIDAAEIREKF